MPNEIKIAIGSDHAGFQTKEKLISELVRRKIRVVDFGTKSETSCDYPGIACRLGKAVAAGRCDRGVLLCGTGIGMSIAANKIRGIRAAVCWNPRVAKLSVEHNWSNILCLPSRFLAYRSLLKVLNAWLLARPDQGGRHERRVGKILKCADK